MKGKSRHSRPAGDAIRGSDPETVALQAFGRVAADGERLGAFMAAAGLTPDTVRSAANGPEFLAGILDHLCSDETLLIAVADEIGLPPEALAAARHALSPAGDPDF